MEFGINYFECRISTTGRISYINLEARHFFKISSICRVLFSNFRGISLEQVDQEYNVSVVEEWLPDEDLLILTIEPIVIGQFVENIVGEHVQHTWGLQEQENIGFPLVRVYVDDDEYVSRRAG